MLTVEEYGRIRRARRDGMSIPEISRRSGHSRRKIRQVLTAPEPRPYHRTKQRECSKLGPFQSLIDQILEDDKQPSRPRIWPSRAIRQVRHPNARRYTDQPSSISQFITLIQLPLQHADLPHIDLVHKLPGTLWLLLEETQRQEHWRRSKIIVCLLELFHGLSCVIGEVAGNQQ